MRTSLLALPSRPTPSRSQDRDRRHRSARISRAEEGDVTQDMNPIAMSSTPSMGGTLTIAVNHGSADASFALSDVRSVAARVDAWASRLTRFTTTSDLARLNETTERSVAIRPTLAAVLDWASTASERTDGIVDATLLDARLAAQNGTDPGLRAPASWTVQAAGRGTVVERPAGVRFDLDGIAKGWIADRAADLLGRWPGVAVAADGDVAISAGPGIEWSIGVEDPRGEQPQKPLLATLCIRGGTSWSARFGVATSGTSVHRWQSADGRTSHHLIDPRSGRPADTDVVQATVVAPSAREAEVIAKTAVILGSEDALGYLDRSAAMAALLLLENGDICCLPGIDKWLA
jgi:thiamine biosynthesis lipoprotein